MTYGVSVTTDPIEEPIGLAEAKSYCQIAQSITAHDQDLVRSIRAARQFIEATTHRSIITQTRELTIDRFPHGRNYILLPFTPLKSITSIFYIDTEGVSTEWASDKFDVSTSRQPGEVRRAWDENWPTVRPVVDAVTITYVAGYGATSDVPHNLRAAMLLLIEHWFVNRSAVVTGTIATTIPLAVDALLSGLSVGDEFLTYGGPP